MIDFHEWQQRDLQAIGRQKQRLQRLVLLRTVSFLAMVFAFAAGFDGHVLGTVCGVLLLAAFLMLVRRHQKASFAKLLTESHLGCVQAFLDRKSGKWRDFSDDGHDLMREDRPQEADLPIFGRASLYQYLSAARTKAGRERLAALLSPFPDAADAIRLRQQAVRELSGKPQELLDLEAMSHLLPLGTDLSAFCTMLEQESIKKSKALRLLSFLLPVLSFVTLALAIAGRLDTTIPGLLFSLQLLLSFLLLRRNQALLAPLMALPQELSVYEQLLARLEEADYKSPLLLAIQKDLREQRASDSLHRLAKLADLAAMRRNVFFFLVANTACLWDLHCTARLFAWKEANGRSLRCHLAAWAEVEALLSLATPALTRQTICWPELCTGGPELTGKAVTPLLIEEAKAVPNDASFAAGTCIITGSNMSGKTTYMRTLATSAILACAGAPVCAEHFALTPMAVYTSIHVSDDLSRGISTFYAEILRIRQMVEASQEERPLLLCIDEIFKGTNSADRITGAAEAIKRLTRPSCITLVTTHDFELCDLQSPNNLPIKNFHFEESYPDDKIHFDFKIRPGRCHTTNARYLLKMAGILS